MTDGISRYVRIRKSPLVAEILRATYPQYRGRKVELALLSPSFVMDFMDSYWDGGSRTYYMAYDTVRKVAAPLSGVQHAPWDPQHPCHTRLRVSDIPDNVLVVKHQIFQGKDCGIQICCKNQPFLPASMQGLLPQED